MQTFARILSFVAAFFLAVVVNRVRALDIVTDGKPMATIVVEGQDNAPPPRVKGKGAKKRAPQSVAGDRMAAEVLADWVKKISGAELPIADVAPQNGAVIYVGRSAIKAGLKIDDIASPTHEGLRVVCDGRRVLLAGQDGTSTVKAACRLLEELGCRYYMDSPLGEVYPHSATVSVKEMDLREKPGLDMREIWGSTWSGMSLWKIWNGAGGLPLGAGHSWGRYVPHELFATHPEYFALRNGQRKQGDWYCTSNPELRKVFADGVMATLAESGGVSASISPPDGIGYCECEKCQAQDDRHSIEPSSGRVAITDRYVDFFNDVARRVRVKYPNAKLNFYCYADYTQAPTRGVKLEDNLVAFIAPLRYCRLHGIGNPICPSRVQLGEMIDAWSRSAHHIGYRAYNFNAAECLVPFSMMSAWKHDLPFLKQRNAVGVNMESLASWQIYGPHMYFSIRQAYDPSINGDSIIDDYFQNFYGPAAGPLMRQYWMGIDHAFAVLPAHAGGFYAIHRVYTPAFLAHCRQLLTAAAEAAKGDPMYSARVAMHAEGFGNAEQYAALREALNSGQGAQAIDIYNKLLARTEAQVTAGYGNHYTPGYLKRFIGKQIAAIATATAAPSRIVQTLPDAWKLQYDAYDAGITLGFARPEFDAAAWKTVATYSDTLDSQSLEDRKTILWYRTSFDLPALKGKTSLLFVEVDGNATVFINGKESGVSEKKRIPFTIDGSALHAGRNTIAVRVDHSAISELFLGGIIRPIYVIEKASP